MALDAGERQRKRGVLVCVDESRIRMQQAGGRLPHRPRTCGGEPGIGVVTGQAAMKRGNQVVAFDHRDRTDILLPRSEEHTSELQSLMRISYAAFCLKKKTNKTQDKTLSP